MGVYVRLEGRVGEGRWGGVGGYRREGHPGVWRQLGERVSGSRGSTLWTTSGSLECDKWANVVVVEMGGHDISPVG